MTVNVYHKHSVVKGKAPDAKQLELGEIAINANQDSPAIYIKDSADNIIEIGGGCDCDEINRRLDEIEHLIESLPTDEQLEKLDNLIELLDQIEKDIEENKKCCESNSNEISDVETRVAVLEAKVRQIELDIVQIKNDVQDNADHIGENKKEIEQNRADLESMSIVAGPGIKITHAQDTYKWVVSMDRTWLDNYVAKMIEDALKPYAKLDIDGNLEELK